jgi:hypothetical protein
MRSDGLPGTLGSSLHHGADWAVDDPQALGKSFLDDKRTVSLWLPHSLCSSYLRWEKQKIWGASKFHFSVLRTVR